MTTIAQIYSFTPVKTEFNNIDYLAEMVKDLTRSDKPYTNQIVAGFAAHFLYDSNEWQVAESMNKHKTDSKRLSFNWVLDEQGDNGKYPSAIFYVSFDNNPFMLGHRSGRYGSDYNVWLTDESILTTVVTWITENFLNPEDGVNLEVSETDVDIEGIDCVGYANLFDFYAPENEAAKLAKPDDLVWAWVEENHLKWDTRYVLCLCKILKVNPRLKKTPYTARVLNYYWGNDSIREKEFKSDNSGCIHAHFNDAYIEQIGDFPVPEMAINNMVDENGKLLKPAFTFDELCEYVNKRESVKN